jgi:hypothetical protein
MMQMRLISITTFALCYLFIVLRQAIPLSPRCAAADHPEPAGERRSEFLTREKWSAGRVQEP